MKNLSPLIAFLRAWLAGVRYRELAAIAAAAYFGGKQLGQYIHVDTAKQEQVGVVLAAIAGICYLLNPKYAGWVEILPHAPGAPSAAPVATTPTEDAFSTPDGGHSDV